MSASSSCDGSHQSDAVGVAYASAAPAAYKFLSVSLTSWRATIAVVAARPVPIAKKLIASPEVVIQLERQD